MNIAWVTLTEVRPKELEKKILRKTIMKFPEVLKEIYHALEELKYELFLIKNSADIAGIGSLSFLKYKPKESKDVFLIIVEGKNEEINAIQSDPRIARFFR